MKAKNLGIFSALFASICCIGPLIPVLVGLGSLGIGAFIGKYHWLFLGGGVLLIIVAWYSYFKERKSCQLNACEMKNKKATLFILIQATLIVIFFVGLNLYAYLGKSTALTTTSSKLNSESVVIPVEGMTCLTCEITVTHALRKVEGVISVSASAKEKSAKVTYDPDKTNINRLIETINKIGYKASMPNNLEG